MSQQTKKLIRATPSATPTEAELLAWAALPRDEQVARYREALAHPDCTAQTSESMKDILVAARKGDKSRSNG
jgi:hypothetical protein